MVFASFGFLNAQIISDPLVINQSHESAAITELIITDSATMINLLINPKEFPVKSLCPGNKITLNPASNDFKRTINIKTQDSGNSNSKDFSLIRVNKSIACKQGEQVPSDMQEVYIQLVFSKLYPPYPALLDLVADSFRFEGICLQDKLALELSLYQRAFEQYEYQNIDSALFMFKNVIDMKDTVHIMYPNAIFNTAVLVETKGDKKKAIQAYKNVLQAKINDAEYLEQGNLKPCNFNHQSCLRLAAIQKKSTKYEEALKYLWLADTAYPFIDTNDIANRKREWMLLTEKIECLDSLRRYKDAVNIGIQALLNNDIPNLGNRQNALVINIIKQHLEYKKFINEFEKSINDIRVSEDSVYIKGKFSFNEKEFEITVPKAEVLKAIAEQKEQFENSKKQSLNQRFLINRIKSNDFYKQLKTKN